MSTDGKGRRLSSFPIGTWVYTEDTNGASVSDSVKDSRSIGRDRLVWLLDPVDEATFFAKHWEKSPLLIQRADSSYFEDLFSVEIFRRLVENETEVQLRHRLDLDVTSVVSGVRETWFEDEALVSAEQEVWRKYTDPRYGCSLRLLRPQEHSDRLWEICAELEEFWECAFGANAYLTPPNSQGYAPHFDDVDVFICQVSGSKRWRVYPAFHRSQILPRFSSADFSPEDLARVEPTLDVHLKAGDLLYLPRGTIHQAECTDEHSLHVTISTSQRWTWADFLSASIVSAISSVAEDELDLRRTLPRGFLSSMGVSRAHSTPSKTQPSRLAFQSLFQRAFDKLSSEYPADAAADLLSRRFFQERQPPPPSFLQDRVAPPDHVQLQSTVRLRFRNAARLVLDDDGELPLLITHVDKPRAGPQHALHQTCTLQEALAIDTIIRAYPSSVILQDLPLDSDQDKIDLVLALVQLKVVAAKP